MKVSERKFNQNQLENGYTLVEIMVAATIFIVVIAIGVGTFNSASGFQSKTQVVRETNQGARDAMELISRDIRTADGVTVFKNALNSTDVTVYGYALVDGSGNLITSTADALNTKTSLKATRIAVFKKADNICPGAVQRTDYYVKIILGNRATITQAMKCVFTNDASSLFNNTFPRNVSDILPLTTEIASNDANALSFEGDYPRKEVKGVIKINQQPQVKIKMDVKSAQYDVNSKENGAGVAELDLQTTVVPRITNYKY